ncbi:hypothetical protein JTE90_008279 [Oedothorax gibbosus]|uniref:RNase NYN domain-containing protein n=1 Tax=Oedothorax gibbosus TaxID=931172 RepID=A0AAV6UH33_9ARAC|nr:hypothetical protein JTE90_008279 [Oedothorax gibbosus]
MSTIERQLQIAIRKITDWTNSNGFVISNQKTICMHFCRKRGLHPDPEITLNGVALPYQPPSKRARTGPAVLDKTPSLPKVPRPMTVKLRPVVIDGSNVARDHGLATNTYSCKGIKISVDYFLRRGHTEITVFIPKFRKHRILGPIPTTDPIILDELEKAGMLSYSPSRTIDGLRQSCYDDRAIVIPIAKPGKDPHDAGNYRPIALTSCLCKLMERMVNARLVYCLEEQRCLISVSEWLPTP